MHPRRQQQSTLIDLIEQHGCAFLNVLISVDQLLDDDTLVEVAQEALARRAPRSRTRGRTGTPAEVALRILVLKHMMDWTYCETEREVATTGTIEKYNEHDDLIVLFTNNTVAQRHRAPGAPPAAGNALHDSPNSRSSSEGFFALAAAQSERLAMPRVFSQRRQIRTTVRDVKHVKNPERPANREPECRRRVPSEGRETAVVPIVLQA